MIVTTHWFYNEIEMLRITLLMIQPYGWLISRLIVWKFLNSISEKEITSILLNGKPAKSKVSIPMPYCECIKYTVHFWAIYC